MCASAHSAQVCAFCCIHVRQPGSHAETGRAARARHVRQPGSHAETGRATRAQLSRPRLVRSCFGGPAASLPRFRVAVRPRTAARIWACCPLHVQARDRLAATRSERLDSSKQWVALPLRYHLRRRAAKPHFHAVRSAVQRHRSRHPVPCAASIRTETAEGSSKGA